MPVTKNTWNKGLSSDLSKLKSQPDSYLYAKNIRVITDLGESTLAVENIRGNKYSFRIPAVSRTFRLDFTGVTGTVNITFTRNINNTPSSFTRQITVTSTDNEIIADRINQELLSNPFFYSQYIKAYYNSDYIVIYDFLPQSVREGNLPVLPQVSGLTDITIDQGVKTLRTSSVLIHTILGWGYYNDNLVLITCAANSTSETPSNTEGFIWDAKYINSTNLIENEDTTSSGIVYLNPLYHLKYAGKLNLSREYAIVKHLKCRFENVDIARVVWTDWYNNLRTCNVLDPQIWATPEELFDYIPNHIPQKPIVRRLIAGGTLPTGKYQYFYQLYSNQGAKSTISPISNLITLYAGTTAGNTLDYANPGNVPGTSSQKSVQVDVINLDVNYDTIRFGYVVYQIPDFPEAFWFDERPVPDDGTITVVHNGNENDIPMDSTEIANLNRPPEVYKTIEVARNRLFAANARTTYFDLTDVFDARAYRFSSTTDVANGPRIAKLYNDSDTFNNPSVIIDIPNNQITVDGVTTNPIDYTLIPETYDVINPFNDENNDPLLNPFSGSNPGDWSTQSQFKYQSNGTTIGGTGLNISYRFTTEEAVVQSGGFYLPADSPYIRPLPDYNSAYTGEFNDTYIYPGGNGQSLDTHKSSLFETLFVGYARGEVYRFGIVFYDKKGFPSYPLWIGDIKFPFASDDNGNFGLTVYDSNANTLPHNIITKQIGIEFTLNTSTTQFRAIKDQISGWSYVRLKRDLNNSTKLGTGYMQPTFCNFGVSYLNLLPFQDSGSLFWGYDTSRNRINIQTFHAPNFYTRAAGDFQPGDYIKFIARTEKIAFPPQIDPTYGQTLNVPSIWNDSASWKGFYVKPNEYNYIFDDSPYVTSSELVSYNPSLERFKFPILDRVFVNYSTNENSIPAAAYSAQPNSLNFRNMSSMNLGDLDAGDYGEWGGECDLISFDNDITSSPNFLQPDILTTGYTTNHIGHPDIATPLSVGILSVIQLPLYLASYERFLTKQYGGNIRAARYSNEYILTNHFMPYDKDTVTGLVINGVWGGDTYVNLFDYQRSNRNYKADSGWDESPTAGSRFSVAVFYPAESFFNTELNTKEQHASVRLNQPSGSDSIFAASYIYNPAYSQQNTTNIFISKAYLQTNIKYEPHTIYGSEPKLDGERLDAWRSILVNNALGVNGNYGEINRLIEFKDKLYYYQNDGFGIASVDERVLTNEGDTTQTQLGTGTLLQRFDYISTETGSKHSFAVEKTGSAIYHYDAFINKLFKFSLDGGAAPITDIEGLSGFFRTAFVNSNLKSLDKLTRISRVGITSGYNSEYNSIYFTFFDTSNGIKQTISYNEALEAFESFYDFYPSLYINMRKRFLSILFEPTISSANDRVYIHNIGNRNIFYNTPYSSEIKFRVNDKSDFVKTFDNFQLNTEVISPLGVQLPSTVTQMQLSNDYQTYPLSNVSFEQKIRSWRLQIPRDETNPNLTIKPRFSDKYLDVTFKYLDVSNNLFRLHDVITEYSLRSKILPR
jgi:hypothetical protein